MSAPCSLVRTAVSDVLTAIGAIALMTEAVIASEPSVSITSLQGANNSEDVHLRNDRRENVKSHQLVLS